MIFESRIYYLSIQVEFLYCLIMRVCLKRGNKMNILVTSAGRRVKIIEYFKESLSRLNGKIIATDCDMNSPAIHFAYNYEIIPIIDDVNYIHNLFDICKIYEINAVISLIDPKLELLANDQTVFDKENIKMILSSPDIIDISFDK